MSHLIIYFISNWRKHGLKYCSYKPSWVWSEKKGWCFRLYVYSSVSLLHCSHDDVKPSWGSKHFWSKRAPNCSFRYFSFSMSLDYIEYLKLWLIATFALERENKFIGFRLLDYSHLFRSVQLLSIQNNDFVCPQNMYAAFKFNGCNHIHIILIKKSQKKLLKYCITSQNND